MTFKISGYYAQIRTGVIYQLASMSDKNASGGRFFEQRPDGTWQKYDTYHDFREFTFTPAWMGAEGEIPPHKWEWHDEFLKDGIQVKILALLEDDVYLVSILEANKPGSPFRNIRYTEWTDADLDGFTKKQPVTTPPKPIGRGSSQPASGSDLSPLPALRGGDGGGVSPVSAENAAVGTRPALSAEGVRFIKGKSYAIKSNGNRVVYVGPASAGSGAFNVPNSRSKYPTELRYDTLEPARCANRDDLIWDLSKYHPGDNLHATSGTLIEVLNLFEDGRIQVRGYFPGKEPITIIADPAALTNFLAGDEGFDPLPTATVGTRNGASAENAAGAGDDLSPLPAMRGGDGGGVSTPDNPTSGSEGDLSPLLATPAGDEIVGTGLALSAPDNSPASAADDEVEPLKAIGDIIAASGMDYPPADVVAVIADYTTTDDEAGNAAGDAVGTRPAVSAGDEVTPLPAGSVSPRPEGEGAGVRVQAIEHLRDITARLQMLKDEEAALLRDLTATLQIIAQPVQEAAV